MTKLVASAGISSKLTKVKSITPNGIEIHFNDTVNN